ncbi:MAG: thioredoxin family protein [Opitutus sp.]
MKPLRLVAVSFAIFLSSVVVSFADATRTKAAKPEHISYGKEVKITDYLVPGKTTVFDFTSQYCPPCRAVAPLLEKLHETRADVAVVKVDINRPEIKGIDWDSPVARQYRLESVPNFKVYGPDGKLVAEGKPASKLVYSWLQ